MRIVLNCPGDGRARISRRATADGVDDHESGAMGVLQFCVDFLGGTHLRHAELGELLAHGGDEPFIVHLEPLLHDWGWVV